MDSLRKRVLFVATTSIIVTAMYFADQPAHWQWLCDWVESGYRRVWIEKEYSIEGLNQLDARVIEAQLPLERSNVWWLWNREVVAASLRSLSLVRSAQVASCDGMVWGCFRVSIEERKPTFYALLGNEGWLIGDDGGVISAVSTRSLAGAFSSRQGYGTEGYWNDRHPKDDEQLQNIHGLPLVTGVWSQALSPDIVRARLKDVPRILGIIEDGSGYSVRTVTFRSGNDIVVHFDSFGFDVTFDIASETAWDLILSDKVRRFRSVVRELGPSTRQVKSIDMAFSQIAVVKTNSEAMLPLDQASLDVAKDKSEQAKKLVSRTTVSQTAVPQTSGAKASMRRCLNCLN